MTWRPIETAPKDGTVVLLYPGGLSWTDEPIPVVGWYSNALREWVANAAGRYNPTDWQPLPEPPEDSA